MMNIMAADTEHTNTTESIDTLSVHVIYDESSDQDKDIVNKLSWYFHDCGILCSDSGDPDIRNKVNLISSATWVIVVWSQLQTHVDDLKFGFDENLSLFMAMCKGLQNVIYLLNPDDSSLVAKGFTFVRMEINSDWFSDIKHVITMMPKAMDGTMFSSICHEIDSIQCGWLTPTSFSLFNSKIMRDNKICWNLVLKDKQGINQYTFKRCGDSFKLMSKEHTGRPSLHASASPSTEDKCFIELDEIPWHDVKMIEAEVVKTKTERNISILIFVILFAFVLASGFGYICLLRTNIVPLIPTSMQYLPYIYYVQLVMMVLGLVLSAAIILNINSYKSPELTFIKTYHSVYTVITLVLYALHLADKLPYVVDVPVGCGVLSVWLYLNMTIVWLYIDSMTTWYTNKTAIWSVTIVYWLILAVDVCCRPPMLYKKANVSIQTTFLINIVLLVCQVGYFRIVVKSIIYFLKIHLQIRRVTAFEIVLLLIFLSIWFGPILLVYQ